MAQDPFNTRETFDTGSGNAYYYSLKKLESDGLVPSLAKLPVSIKILLEGALRGFDGVSIREDDIRALAGYNPANPEQTEVPYQPGRVLLQDFTGVPAVVDLAALRSAMARPSPGVRNV